MILKKRWRACLKRIVVAFRGIAACLGVELRRELCRAGPAVIAVDRPSRIA